MKKIRVVIGTNDGEKISPCHMGEAENFKIYDIYDNGNSDFIDNRKNTSPDLNGKHGAIEKMKVVMSIIKDADVVVGRKMSPNFLRISSNSSLQPVVVKYDSFSIIIDTIIKSFDEIFSLVERRRSGEKSLNIPVLKD